MQNTAMYFRDEDFFANQDMYFEWIAAGSKRLFSRMDTG